MAHGFHMFIQKKRTMKPLAIASSESGRGQGREAVGAIYPMYNVSLFGIVRMNPPYTTNTS
jgi:hypothetical protein